MAILAFIASLSWGGCILLLTKIILDVVWLSTHSTADNIHDRHESQQLELIRQSNAVFQYAEHLVNEVADLMKDSSRISNIHHYLGILDLSPPWSAVKFMATKLVEGIILGGVIAFIILLGANFFVALAVWAGMAGLYYQFSLSGLKTDAESRKKSIKMRLPFIIDLMALTRGAGASFGESLEVAAKDNADHPAGAVFSRSLHEYTYGSGQKTVLDNLAERMQDPDFQEIAFAINKADELGTPVAKTLTDLASQMRLKRQQWGEKASNEAEVKILFPGLIIMLACMLVILCPFILMALYGNAPL